MTIKRRGIILYDHNCSICLIGMRLGDIYLRHHGWLFSPIQHEEICERLLHLDQETALQQMHVCSHRHIYHGYDAVSYIIANGNTNSLAWKMLQIPIFKKLGDKLYHWIAVNRHCSIRSTQQQCSRPSSDL